MPTSPEKSTLTLLVSAPGRWGEGKVHLQDTGVWAWCGRDVGAADRRPGTLEETTCIPCRRRLGLEPLAAHRSDG